MEPLAVPASSDSRLRNHLITGFLTVGTGCVSNGRRGACLPEVCDIRKHLGPRSRQSSKRVVTAAAGGKGFGKQKGCDCGSGLPYDQCCGEIHDKKRKAEEASELMRARYTAYCRKLVDFIMESTAGANDMESSEKYRSALKVYMETTKFKKLKILKCERGMPGDDEGFVTFEVTANKSTYTERSRFVPHESLGWIFVQEPEAAER